jgi:hypothetical protein
MSETITIEQIYSATNIEESLKRVLLGLEEQDLRPAQLTKWARETFREARKYNHEDDEIVEWVKAVGNSRHYHQSQIDRVLTDNGIVRYTPRPGGGSGSSGGIGNWYNKFKTIALDATKVDETKIIDANYSPSKVVRMAEDEIVNWVTKMNDADYKQNLRWLRIVQAILQRGSELIEQKMKQPKIGV